MRRYLANELQNPSECAQFCTTLQGAGVRSYLEIGSKFGGSLWQVAQTLPKGSSLVAVDLEPTADLRQCADDIREYGHGVNVIGGDSSDPETVERVRALGPFDAVLIDGNHSEPFVSKDWNNYGPMARLVAFHDIGKASETNLARKPWRADVPALWEKLRDQYRHIEIRAAKGGIGFGVLWQW